MSHGVTAICTGGGGMPIVERPYGALQGVGAVIDKDFAGALLAHDLQADRLALLTDVDAAYLDWGKPNARGIKRAHPALLDPAMFPAGSMHPKIEAAMDFTFATGKSGVFGALEHVAQSTAGTDRTVGTTIDTACMKMELHSSATPGVFARQLSSFRVWLVCAAGTYDRAEARSGLWLEFGRVPKMKALVYLGPGKKALEERPKPAIGLPSDAIVRITKTTICGTDLHILKGDVPTCTAGRILGHEGVGVIDTVGAAVTAFKPGDRVLISCVSACGKCIYCRKQMYSHCTTGGWILGNSIDGTQAEYVRIPHADTSLYPIPKGADEEALVMLSDILPTGFECGVLNGRVQPGSIVAIVGSGPIGLAALLTAQFYSPAEIIMIDLDDNRLEVAKRFGATATINSRDGKAVEKIMAMTENRGVDTAIEAVGISATFGVCQQIIGPGGTIANIGVHGTKVDLHLEQLWDRNISITTRLVDTVSTPMLLKVLQSKKIDPKQLITHRFKLDAILEAYETFANAASTNALKVMILASE